MDDGALGDFSSPTSAPRLGGRWFAMVARDSRSGVVARMVCAVKRKRFQLKLDENAKNNAS